MSLTTGNSRYFPHLWHQLEKGIRSVIHGPNHWERVRRNGMLIAEENGAHKHVVELFALLHDLCRWDDGHDPEHGRRAAAYAHENRGTLPDLDDNAFQKLIDALAGHVDGLTTDDPTIGACWDADRLDIGRVGIRINPIYLCTPSAKRIALQLRAKSK